jgi:Predicted membrane protein
MNRWFFLETEPFLRVRASMLSKPKSRKVAALLAFIGTVIPICGLHKFYLGQPLWGILYLLLWKTHIPQIASAIEGVWYLAQARNEFDHNFNQGMIAEASSGTTQPAEVDPAQVGAIADALRKLDSLRQDGLMSEYEFEQKRRQLLDRIV